MQDAFLDWTVIWQRSLENWHYPQLPLPRERRSEKCDEFPFENYLITIDQDSIRQGSLYIENLFDHIIVHYLFCPRSLETAGRLALAAMRGLKDQTQAGSMVNIFSDIVVDSFRLERSAFDEKKVVLGWARLASQKDLSKRDRVILGFLGEYWGAALPRCPLPEVEQLLQVFSSGVRDKNLWPRQCQQVARILEPLFPGLLGRGPVQTLEILNGSAHGTPLAFASDLEPSGYEEALGVLGLQGDLKRWYRDQSCQLEIRSFGKSRIDCYPSALNKWRLDDPWSELDLPYSLGFGTKLIPGVTTFKRSKDFSRMAAGRETVPDLLVVLDSSRSMEGHALGTKTHKATLSAFKACHYAQSEGAEIAAINFSENYVAVPWTRDLSAVEDVLLHYHCARTHIPGKAVLDLAGARRGCLILCITDTHIQNLYQEWDYLKRASLGNRFVLFCIDQAGRDKHVEETLRDLGRVYYINRLEDLLALVVEATEAAYAGESFISSKQIASPGAPG